MTNKINDMQKEMFDEFQNQSINNKNELSINKEKNFLNIEFLKDVKIEVSLDILLILGIIFILFSLTMYFLGLQRGEKIKKEFNVNVQSQQILNDNNKVSLVASKTPVLVSKNESDNIVPIIVSKKDYLKYKNDENKSNIDKISKESESKVIKKETKQEIKKEDKKTEIKNTEIISANKENKDGNKYTIQIAASKDETAAIKEVQKLSLKGFSAFIISSADKKWYKICIGRFKKSSESEKILKELKTKENYRDCFLTHL